MRARVLLPAAFGLLAGGAALILALRAGPGEAPGSPRTGSEAVGTQVAGPVLGGGAHPVADASDAADAADAAVPKDSISPLPTDLPPWGFAFQVVRGARRMEMDPAPGATVHVALVGPEDEGVLHEWHATTDQEGAACRIGPLTLPPLPRRWAGEAALEVRVEAREGSPPTSAWARRYALDELAARVRRAPDGDGVRWLSSTLRLWTLRRVGGRLLTSSGHPVGGVWVGVKPSTDGFSASPIDWDGAFQVEVPADGGVLPKLEIEVGGAFEIQQLLDIDLPDDGEVLDVRLPGGDEARGRVTDAEGKGLSGVHLVLARPWWDPNAGFTFARGGYTPPTWTSRMKTLSAVDGSFAFAGLLEGEAYVLWWPGDDDEWRRLPDDVFRGDDDLDVVLTRHRFRPVLADADTGERVYGQVRLRQVKDDDEPYYPSLRAMGATPEEDGRIAAPGERYRLYAWARGFEVAVETFTMPSAAGTYEVPVAMRPVVPDRVVRLRFEDAAGAALGPLPIVLTREIPGLWGDLDLRIPLEEEAGGWIRLRDLPAGPVHLETKDRLGHPPNGRWRHVLPLALELEIPETGAFDREIACALGGSVRLFLRLPPEAEPQDMGELRLVHESGAEDSPWWYAALDDEHWDFEIIGDGRFEPDGRTYESSALPPGAWTLAIEESEAWRAVSLPLRLASGEITDVRVTLEARD